MSKTYSEAISNTMSHMLERGEQVVNDVWHILDHKEFPFATLTSTTNGFKQFPSYNIVEGDNGVRLEMAVAGYSKDRIKVEQEGNVLIIQGTPAEPKPAEAMRHQGISNAAWLRTFDLVPDVEISNVQLKDGILTVHVTAPKPTQSPRTKFDIKA